MIPMTVSFFLKGSESASAGRFKASMYGLFIVLLYTVPIAAIILLTRLLGGDAVTADIFNWLATHWLPNLIFFIVFMVFAASFFGAFEITLPGWMVNKSDRNADRGGLLGVFFMAPDAGAGVVFVHGPDRRLGDHRRDGGRLLGSDPHDAGLLDHLRTAIHALLRCFPRC